MNTQKSLLTERIFRLLYEKGLSNKDLEQAVGKSSSTVANWKSRMNPIDADMIAPICELLGVSCDFLLRGDEGVTDERIGTGRMADPLEEELLSIFRGLSDAGKQRLIGRAEEMLVTYGLSGEYPQAK